MRGRALAELVKNADLGLRALVTVSQNLDAVGPFWDPLEPLSREQLQKAADQFGWTLSDLEVEVAEWSKALGWNLLQGLKAREQPGP